MLRRLPTAIAISSEDITAYEEDLAHRIALLHYRKTGEDPEGRFTGGVAGSGHGHPGTMNGNNNKKKDGNAVDPNDELKPLPGDKARIVRSREERIMGGR